MSPPEYEKLAMWTLFLADAGLSLSACVLSVDARSVLRASASDTTTLANHLDTFLSIVLTSQITVLATMAFTVFYWTVVYRRLLASMALYDPQSSGGLRWQRAYGWPIQLACIVVMAAGYLLQFTSFGISIPLVGMAEKVGVLDDTNVRDTLTAVRNILSAAIGMKTAQLTLGHGWAVARSRA